jgi:hypothetical protein
VKLHPPPLDDEPEDDEPLEPDEGKLFHHHLAAISRAACVNCGSSPTARRLDRSPWKFDGFTADMFWVVRADGSYRLHGWGVGNQQQRGRFEEAKGQWSINAPNWQDAGTYKLVDANT